MDADLDQREADHRHDKAGHERGQGKANFADEEAKEGMEQPAYEDPAHEDGDRVNAFARNKRDHHGDEGKGGALHDGQARSDRAKADGLKQGRDAGKEHRHLDHVDHFGEVGRVRAKAEARCATDDNRGGDVGDKHGEDVLNPEGHGLGQWWGVIGVAELLRCCDGRISHGFVSFLFQGDCPLL